MSLEKIITYSSAILDPESALEKFDNSSRIRLKPLNNLIYLCHFDSDKNLYEPWYAISEEIRGLKLQNNFAGFAPGYQKFGTNCLINCPWKGYEDLQVLGEISESLVGLKEGAIDFWFASGDLTRQMSVVKRKDKWNAHFNYQGYICPNIGFILWTSEGEFDLIAENLYLTNMQYYHYRASWSENEHSFKLFLDGEEIAGGEFQGTISEDYDLLNNPYLVIFSECYAEDNPSYVIDELRIFNEYMPDEFTPESSATKPYSQDVPKAKIALDAGVGNAVWDLSNLSFLDETDFNNGGIKIRVDADEDNTPGFSGDLLTLEQVRNLLSLSGRYLHLEFNFISDGDAQRTLYSGKVGLNSKPLLLPRRAPEIIRRF